MNNVLFETIKIGNLNLENRVVMAPLTRSRAGQPGNVPTNINVEYYRQRASAALIITEATQISQQGQGYGWTPGIHTQQQIDGWKVVADAVHEQGGHIFMQLWHVGRVSHPVFQPDGGLPVAPSAIAAPGKTFIVNSKGEGEWADVPEPKALTEKEIDSIISDYTIAAKHAIKAGMDGVEIHAGNGYLLDQFINSNSNKRHDKYGGNYQNRAQLLLDVTRNIIAEIGADRVGVRLTPMGRFMGMGDESPMKTFGYIAEELSKQNIAYLHLVEPAMVGTDLDSDFNPEWDDIISLMREKYDGIVILAGGYDKNTAEQAIKKGRTDLIAFGRPFIANPDLPLRFANNYPLAEANPDTFFGGNEIGYTDYPIYKEQGDTHASE